MKLETKADLRVANAAWHFASNTVIDNVVGIGTWSAAIKPFDDTERGYVELNRSSDWRAEAIWRLAGGHAERRFARSTLADAGFDDERSQARAIVERWSDARDHEDDFKALDAQSAALVDENLPAIGHVAEALAEHRKLEEEALWQILDAAFSLNP
jgi:hypothetical protein